MVSIQRIIFLGRLRREPTVDEVKSFKSIQIFQIYFGRIQKMDCASCYKVRLICLIWTDLNDFCPLGHSIIESLNSYDACIQRICFFECWKTRRKNRFADKKEKTNKKRREWYVIQRWVARGIRMFLYFFVSAFRRFYWSGSVSDY